MTVQKRRGLLTSVEGIDGSGKSTSLPALADWLRERGHEVVMTREPGGTPVGEKLRDMVLHMPMDPLAEALLMFASRRDHIKTVIEPALARGAIVLCDRFTDSSFAYQGAGRGFSIEVLTQLEAWVTEGLQPDLTLWYDLPADEAARRRSAARAADRFEQEEIAFFERVRAGYQHRMDADPRRFVRIDALRTRGEVWDDMVAIVGAFLQRTQERTAIASCVAA